MRKLIATLLVVVAATMVVSARAAEPKLVAPEQDAVVSLAPDVMAQYKSPDQRDWDLKYRPVELKGGPEDKDCSQPKKVEFQWEPVDGDATYTLEVSTCPEFTDAATITRTCGSETSCSVVNLNIGTAYSWRVKADVKTGEDSYETTYSPVGSFKTAFELPRWYDVPHITNVRDAGGWKAADGKRVKMGLLFRGSEMDQHFELTPEGRDVMLREMGIRVDLELRGPSEWKNVENYYSPLGRDAVKWLHFPISAYDNIFNERNEKLFREMFKMFADKDSYPIYIHCMAGADRTGTTLIAIKSVLGVSDNDLFADYEMTSFSSIGSRRIGQSGIQNMMKKLDEYEGDSYGAKFVSFLKKIGVTDEELDSIREILLEDDAQ